MRRNVVDAQNMDSINHLKRLLFKVTMLVSQRDTLKGLQLAKINVFYSLMFLYNETNKAELGSN